MTDPKLREWLDEKIDKNIICQFPEFLPDAIPEEPTRLQVLTYLVTINGGFKPTGYGFIFSGPQVKNAYGKEGLEQSEAQLLIEWTSFLMGYFYANGDQGFEVLSDAVEEEYKRVEALREESDGV